MASMGSAQPLARRMVALVRPIGQEMLVTFLVALDMLRARRSIATETVSAQAMKRPPAILALQAGVAVTVVPLFVWGRFAKTEEYAPLLGRR